MLGINILKQPSSNRLPSSSRIRLVTAHSICSDSSPSRQCVSAPQQVWLQATVWPSTLTHQRGLRCNQGPFHVRMKIRENNLCKLINTRPLSSKKALMSPLYKISYLLCVQIEELSLWNGSFQRYHLTTDVLCNQLSDTLILSLIFTLRIFSLLLISSQRRETKWMQCHLPKKGMAGDSLVCLRKFKYCILFIK